jgi:heptosyltransferase-1
VNAGVIATRPESLLIVRLGAMGDVIHTLAAVTALRNALPEIRIGWAIERRWSELLCANGALPSGPRNPLRPLVDFVHTTNTKDWRKSPFSGGTLGEMVAVRREIREQRYEIAADFQGALKSAVVARISGAGRVAGFKNPRERPARFLYKETFAAKAPHVIEQYHSLAEGIVGHALPGSTPLLPRDAGAEASVASRFPLGSDMAIINPGAGWGAKQWPAERYGRVARALASEGFVPVVNYGPGEQQLALRVNAVSGGAARLFSGSLSELIALTRSARLFIGGDTGPLHLAAALHVPVVAIFGPTDPARNGPYGTRSVVLRNQKSHASLSHVNEPDPGLLRITAEEVLSAARKLLETPSA